MIHDGLFNRNITAAEHKGEDRGFSAYATVQDRYITCSLEFRSRMPGKVHAVGESMSRYDWGENHPQIERINREIDLIRSKVISHQSYQSLGTIGAIRTFINHHVFAEWDFMSCGMAGASGAAIGG